MNFLLFCAAAVSALSPNTTNYVPIMSLRSIEALRSAIPTAPVALVHSYYANNSGPYSERGGGTFVLRKDIPAIDDGGWHIVPRVGGGVWERVLNGATANVCMFGAIGNDYTDNTLTFSNAAYACRLGFSGEMVIPIGGFVKTNKTVIGNVHWHGESRSQSRVIMTADVDAFRTELADDALRLREGETPSWYYDEDLSFEDMTINLPRWGSNSSALVVYQPGEANSTSGLHLNGGGWGIKILGMGTPGLRNHDSTMANQYHASIEVQGWINGHWRGYGGPMIVDGLSSDHRRVDSDATASVIYINRAYGPVSINGLKVEGQYGGGVVRYWFSEGTPGIADDTLASVRITDSTYNRDGIPNVPFCDFLVLQSDGARTASAILQNINPTNVRWLIREDVQGTHVPNGPGYLQGTIAPVTYQAPTARQVDPTSLKRRVLSPKAAAK